MHAHPPKPKCGFCFDCRVTPCRSDPCLWIAPWILLRDYSYFPLISIAFSRCSDFHTGRADMSAPDEKNVDMGNGDDNTSPTLRWSFPDLSKERAD